MEGAILFGVYTGQRLGDIARLRWENIDLETDTLAFTTRKTHRRQILPIAPPLRKWLGTHRHPKAPSNGSLFPALLAKVGKAGRVGPLSNQFYGLMASVGLVAPRSHQRKADGLGRDGRRDRNNLSFHSLRHTATSLMKNAGVSPAIVQEFVLATIPKRSVSTTPHRAFLLAESCRFPTAFNLMSAVSQLFERRG